MTLLTKLWKITFGLLSVFLGLLIILRIFPDELKTVGCVLSGDNSCATANDPEPTVKIGSLIHQLQEGVKQVQQLNATQKNPHMFFVDGLQVELLFTVKETSDNKLDLVVVPAGATAGTENINTQKMVLEFSTTTDANIQDYINEGCKPDSLMGFDVRLDQYCRNLAKVVEVDPDQPTVRPVAVAEPVSTEIDLGEVGITWSDFASTREFGYSNQKSAPLTTETNVLCETYDLCPDVTVRRFDYDQGAGTVSSFNVDVADDKKAPLLKALESGEVVTEGWQIEDNPAGGLLITPEAGQ